MDFYERLKSYKETNGLSNEDLGKHIGLTADAFRMAMKRERLSDLQKQVLEPLFTNVLGENHPIQKQLDEVSRFLSQYTELALQDARIKKIIDKEVAKRLFEVASSKEALEKFLNS